MNAQPINEHALRKQLDALEGLDEGEEANVNAVLRALLALIDAARAEAAELRELVDTMSLGCIEILNRDLEAHPGNKVAQLGVEVLKQRRGDLLTPGRFGARFLEELQQLRAQSKGVES